MKYINFLFLSSVFLVASCQKQETHKVQEGDRIEHPNIVIIYLDDLGYGDVSSYGATEINTPNIDLLADEGIRFTDAHASSATCTPSRYALLTGMYPWRNKNARILSGSAPLLISTEQQTIPKLLKQQGYQTGIVGKWHLGLGNGNVNWNKRVSPGPNEVGFDYAYIMAATQDRVPTVYIEDGDVVGLDPSDPIEVSYSKNFEGEPTAKDNPELVTMKWEHGHNNSIVNGIGRIGYMKGGEAAKWSDVDMSDHFLTKAQEYIQSRKKNEPFFLYYALQQPHVPRTPHPRFAGKSGMGPRGDVILEADWSIGEFMNTLKEEGLLENTLVILTSDNGPVLNDGYYDDAVEKIGNHTPSGPLRGGKYSLFEAGTRVPFITYWKGEIKPGVSDALISQMDILASIGHLTGITVDSTDSQDFKSVLFGETKKGRQELILEATSRTALRYDNWLMIPPYKGPAVIKSVNIEIGNSKDFQLYNLNDDIGQQDNLAKNNPEKLNELNAKFHELKEEWHHEPGL
jgi:arylsulfatase A-like enzyme